MKKKSSLGEIDRNILDIITLYGSLEFLELWYETGEHDALKKQELTKDELLKRLEFLLSHGYVARIMDSKKITRWTLKK